MDRMKELVEILNEAGKTYEQMNKEIMPNHEYDRLYDELLSLEKQTGIVLSTSPTQKVGFEIMSSLAKVTHETPMLSLDKTKSITVLEDFLKDEDGILSWKLDGLTIVLKYLNGELVQAITRGNGIVGEDVTHNAKFFSNIPRSIAYKGELVLRGEAVISYEEFERINESLGLEDKYKNPRNLCSGTVRQLNSETFAGRNVSYFVYQIINSQQIDFKDKKENQLKWANEQGFEVVYYEIVNKSNLKDAILRFESNISHNPFGSDGLVLTFNSISLSSSLGSTSKFPKDSLAFKWEDEIKETTLVDVIWNTSRTGLINPIAIFSPVEIEGTTVSKASLHNVSILENLKLGLGDKIKVYKANMIIPQVSENITCSNTLTIPSYCNVCGGEAQVIGLNDNKALYCTNPFCKARLVSSLAHFASRDCMNIEGFSEATIEKFVEYKLLDNYVDIYKLERYEREIKEMDGFGERSFNKLMNSIENSKNPELYNFIFALGINQVGLSNAKLLCNYFNFDMNKIRNATEEELNEIEGFGKIIAHSIFSYFHNDIYMALMEEALTFIKIKEFTKSDKNETLKDMSFVITGDVAHFKNRKELQQLIENLGGKVTGSVTSKTNLLINNDTNSSSSKNMKAKALNISIISEEEFVKQFLN